MRVPLPGSTGGRWAGLACQVDSPARPGLRVEVTGGRRLLIRQADRVVVLAVQRAGHRGVYYAGTGLYRSPLPPMTAADARWVRETSVDDEAWAARWTHRFADLLETASEGPLHTGQWTLAWGMPSWTVAGHWQRLTVVDPDQGHITWFGYGDPDEDQRDVLPLRRLHSVSADRVRSYRRQVREGIAPPALLWWVGGLDTLVLLDGHDRVVAALAEGTVPQVVVLSPGGDPLQASSAHSHLVRGYEGRMRHQQAAVDHGDELARTRIANLSRQFAEQLNGVTRTEGRTRAWLVPGGPTAWEHHAAQLVPDWSAEPD